MFDNIVPAVKCRKLVFMDKGSEMVKKLFNKIYHNATLQALVHFFFPDKVILFLWMENQAFGLDQISTPQMLHFEFWNFKFSIFKRAAGDN